MSAVPGSEFIPAAWIVPAFIIRAAVAIIEAARDLGDDLEEEDAA